VTLATKVVRHDADGKMFLDVTLSNPGPQVALAAHLQLHRGTSRERVLPVYYTDNYFSLAPKEEKTVTIEATLSDLKGEKPLVLVDGWNVAVTPISSETADLALNEQAQVSHWPQNGLPFAQPKVEPEDEVHLNCGGDAREGFREDPGYPDGGPGAVSEEIDTNVPMAAPEDIYRTVWWGARSYPFALKPRPGQTYTVRLHFAELSEKVPGKRVFNVSINGKPVLTDLDVLKEAGGKDRALVKQFTGIVPDGSGRITIGIDKGKVGTPQVNGIEILVEKK
jgi:hypothetical protein